MASPELAAIVAKADLRRVHRPEADQALMGRSTRAPRAGSTRSSGSRAQRERVDAIGEWLADGYDTRRRWHSTAHRSRLALLLDRLPGRAESNRPDRDEGWSKSQLTCAALRKEPLHLGQRNWS